MATTATAVSTAAVQSTPASQAAAYTRALAPIEWQNAAHTVALVLSSNGTDRYRVTRSADAITCSCTAASFGRPCRHVKAVQAAIAAEALRIAKQAASLRFCAQCGVNPARQCGNYCSDACQQRAAAPVLAMAVEAECFAHCVRCGTEYRYSEASPLLCGACAQGSRIAA